MRQSNLWDVVIRGWGLNWHSFCFDHLRETTLYCRKRLSNGLTSAWGHQWGSRTEPKWRALSCKWRWQTTSAPGGDGTQREGVRGQRMKRQTPLQPLDRMKKEREMGGWGGCLREGGSSTWVQNGRHKPPSSSSQRQGDTGATVPIEVFVSPALSCFSSANRGYNEGGMLPSPRAKGLSILDLSDPEWPNQPSHENQVNDLLPSGSPPCEVGDSYNFNK